MLVAHFGQVRVRASVAIKGHTYHCPGCGQEVTLKQGRKVIHHFAHKPPVTCSWAAGETVLHLKAKEAFYDFFSGRGGATVELEYPLDGGNLRADVYVTGANGKRVAFELQHSPISHDEIERRTARYFALGIALIWVPLLRPERIRGVFPRKNGDGLIVQRYTPKPFERWLHGFNFGQVWYFDPENGFLWHGKFGKSMIEVPASEWYEQGGTLVQVGGYERISTRWRKLTLTGPLALDDVGYHLKKREDARIGQYWYPGGVLLDIRIR